MGRRSGPRPDAGTGSKQRSPKSNRSPMPIVARLPSQYPNVNPVSQSGGDYVRSETAVDETPIDRAGSRNAGGECTRTMQGDQCPLP